MTLRRITDAVPYTRPCPSPYHDPPKQIVLAPGTYTHSCPACGEVTTFVVRRIMHEDPR